MVNYVKRFFSRFYQTHKTKLFLLTGIASLGITYSAPIYREITGNYNLNPKELAFQEESRRRHKSILDKAEKLKTIKDPDERKKLQEELKLEIRNSNIRRGLHSTIV